MTNPLTKADAKPRIDTTERGRTGLNQYSGRIAEVSLRQLDTFEKRRKIFREMRHDSTIRAFLFVMEMFIRKVPWTVQAGSDDEQGIEDKLFVEECMDDLSASWEDTLCEISSFIWEGFSWHEIVYKYRNGLTESPGESSKHRDGKIGWRKFPIRAQDTLQSWDFDEEGGVSAFVQSAPPYYRPVSIPIDKSLLFRTTTAKGNPEGESVLMGAFIDWYRKKNIETIESIGVERDLAGFPVAIVPPEWTDENAPAGMKAAYEAMCELVTRIKRDEQEGAVIPAAYDDNGNKIVDLQLLTSGGKRQFDTNQIIARLSQGIARSVGAQFMYLGSGKTGSWALSSDQTELFAEVIGAWLGMIASVFNRHAVPRLFRLNGWERDALPRLVPGDIEKPDLEKLGSYVKILSDIGVDLTGIDTANYLLDAAGLPMLPDDVDEEADEFDTEPTDEEMEVEETMKATRELLADIRKAVIT